GAVLLDQRARLAARLLVRRDRGDEHHRTGPRQPRRDPADALDVRVAILLREPEALREMRANDVAVEVVDDEATALELGTDDVGIEALRVPVDERVDLPDAVAVRPLHLRRGRAARRLLAPDAGDPRVVRLERTQQRLDLADVTAAVGVALPQVRALAPVLLGD